MPNWNSILREISQTQALGFEALDRVRRKHLKRLFRYTGRNVIAYYSGFLSKPGIEGTQITDEDKNGLMLGIHQLDRTKGLDLILHTPGGGVAATESLVEYLRQMFGRDVRAIIPQVAMSAGTMLACSCKSIVMGKHSNLGPIDPQVSGFPAFAVLAEVNKAFEEILANPATAPFWAPRLSLLSPTFVQQCHWAIERSKTFIEETLRDNMFADLPAAKQSAKLATALKLLTDLAENKSHDRHLHAEECRQAGLVVEALEEDPKLQDMVLTIHHCFMHTLSNSPAFKIIENHLGRAIMKQQQLVAAHVGQGLPLGPMGGPQNFLAPFFSLHSPAPSETPEPLKPGLSSEPVRMPAEDATV